MNDSEKLAATILEKARTAGIMITTAESCTGGMIASALTDIAGSSDVFDRGFVTYSNEAKIDMVGVLPETIRDHGAVSEQTALAMAEGALSRSKAGLSVSVTGIAGPGGGSETKPVGTVWFATSHAGVTEAVLRTFPDEGRAAIRSAAKQTALELLLGRLK